MKRIPGFIEILRSPEDAGGGAGGSTGGGAPSTSPTPAAPAPSAPAASESSSPSGAPSPSPEETSPQPLAEDAFAGFGAIDDEEGEIVATPTEKPAAPAAPATPTEKPAPAEAAKPAAQEEKPAPTEQPVQPGQPEAQVPQLPTPAEPAKIAQALLGDIDALSEHLAGTDFKLSEGDIEAINADFVSAVPKLMARTFVRAQASAMAQMERVIPAMVDRYMKVSKARDASEGKFYGRWPDIKKDQHGQIVDRLAATYRRENPQAPLEQMVEELGPLVMMVAKITPKVGAAPQQNGSGGRPLVAAGRQPPPPPFQPAVGGPASPPQAPEASPWDGYGAEVEES